MMVTFDKFGGETMATVKRKKAGVLFWVLLSSVCILLLSFVVFGNSGRLRMFVDNFFYPKISGIVECNQEKEWHTVSFSLIDETSKEYNKESFSYSTPFVRKLLVCSASSSDKSSVEIRVLDQDGNIVIDKTTMTSDSSVSLETLDDKTEYVLQCRYGEGRYFFNICWFIYLIFYLRKHWLNRMLILCSQILSSIWPKDASKMSAQPTGRDLFSGSLITVYNLSVFWVKQHFKEYRNKGTKRLLQNLSVSLSCG